MTAQEILNTLIKYLGEHVHGGRGSLIQSPYRDDFFSLFKIAYKNDYFSTNSRPRLTGDGIKDAVFERWIPEGDAKEEKKKAFLNYLCNSWDDWKFAWDNFPDS